MDEEEDHALDGFSLKAMFGTLTLEDMEEKDEETDPCVCALNDDLWEPEGFDNVSELCGLTDENVKFMREDGGYFALSDLERSLEENWWREDGPVSSIGDCSWFKNEAVENVTRSGRFYKLAKLAVACFPKRASGRHYISGQGILIDEI